jgi:LMBR1 domain-containing protein 1
MDLFWEIFYWAIPVWVFILIPMCTFYYEADDGMLMAGTSYGAKQGAKPNSRVMEAIKYEMFVVAIFGTIFTITYLLLNETAIPVREVVGVNFSSGPTYTITPTGTSFTAGLLAPMGSQDTAVLTKNFTPQTLGIVNLNVDPSIFYAGLMAWIGWFVFAIFGGIGMAAMPLDLILAFTDRPRHMDAVEFAEAQVILRDRVNELVNVGELLKIEREERAQANGGKGGGFFSREARKEAADLKRTMLQFKQAVYLLEEDVEDFTNCTANYKNYNPLIPYFYLLGGFCAFAISICWLLQIILFVLPPTPVIPFLNTYFEWFDQWFPLFGVLSVAIFSFYLLICAVKGCFKFGLRFLFFQIHPMKPNKTYMSSFLFNVALILLCALPVVQFSVTAFQEYARYTTINQVVNVQLKYLKFFGWFWQNKFFEYALLAISLLTCVYLGCKPRDSSSGSDSMALRDRLRSG